MTSVRLIRDCNFLIVLDLGEALQSSPVSHFLSIWPCFATTENDTLGWFVLVCKRWGENGRTVTCGRMVSCVGLSARDVMLDFSSRPTGPGFIVLHGFLAGDGHGEISMKQGWGNIHYIAQVGNKSEPLSQRKPHTERRNPLFANSFKESFLAVPVVSFSRFSLW